MPIRRTDPILILCAAALLALGGCSGSAPRGESARGSWLDPLQSASPLHTAVAPDAAASRAKLNAAPVCCQTLAELRFEPLSLDTAKFYTVDETAEAFPFETGRSFVRAFSIPPELERATVTLDAVAGATVFAPSVLILDSDHRVSRAIDADRFEYTPAGFMEPQRLRGRFHLDRRRGGELADERYLVVFTTDESMNGSTQMVSEARLYAQARGLADPRTPDPVAKHAATGVFRITLRDLETGGRVSGARPEERRDASRYVDGGAGTAAAAPASRKAAPAPAAPAPEPKPKPAPAEGMLPDTQALYDRMIRESVGDGDMDRAWRLVQEAERAGSTSARRTFLNAVERK